MALPVRASRMQALQVMRMEIRQLFHSSQKHGIEWHGRSLHQDRQTVFECRVVMLQLVHWIEHYKQYYRSQGVDDEVPKMI